MEINGPRGPVPYGCKVRIGRAVASDYGVLPARAATGSGTRAFSSACWSNARSSQHSRVPWLFLSGVRPLFRAGILNPWT